MASRPSKSSAQDEDEIRAARQRTSASEDTRLLVRGRQGGQAGRDQSVIGRRPIASFGNSDGDLAMLQYTTINNPRPSFGLIVHHTDGDREYAYTS